MKRESVWVEGGLIQTMGQNRSHHSGFHTKGLMSPGNPLISVNMMAGHSKFRC